MIADVDLNKAKILVVEKRKGGSCKKVVSDEKLKITVRDLSG